GLVFILTRHLLEARLGSYGGLVVLLLGALLATPLLGALAARLLQPLARRFLGIEGRLGADNLVRAPARTGLGLAAVAAAVALIIQTAGTLRSNREAVHDWVERYLTADLFVTPNSPVSALGSSQVMDPGLGRQIRRLSPRQIVAVVPVRYRHPIYQDNEIALKALPARQFYETDSNHTRKVPHLDLYLQMSRQPGTALVSENFAALYGISPGDTIQLSGVSLRVLGTVKDYYGNLGTVIMDWDDCCKQFNYTDRQVDRFEVYLQPGVEAQSIGTKLARNLTALDVKTHREVQRHFSDVIERLYAIAYGQQIVVAL